MQRIEPSSSSKSIHFFQEAKSDEKKMKDEIAPDTAYAYISALRKILFSFVSSAGATRQLSEEVSVYGIAAIEVIYSGLAAIILIAELVDRICVPVKRDEHSSVKSGIYFAFRACAIALNILGATLLIVGLTENIAAAAISSHNFPSNNNDPLDANAPLAPLSGSVAGQNLNPKSMGGVVAMAAGWALTLAVDGKSMKLSKLADSPLDQMEEVLEEEQEESNSRVIKL